MTDTRDALMRAILVNPFDDTVRLAFADHCRENGDDARADFIEVQVRIGEIQRDCGCGACVRLRGGGQHHNGPCGIDRERIENPDGTSRQAFLRMRERELFIRLLAGGDAFIDADGLATDSNGVEKVYRRGFVSAVRCRLADWVGAEQFCEGCFGSNQHSGAGHANFKMSECPTCKGKGKTWTGHGPRIVAEQPVERVEISDWESCIVEFGDGMPDDARFGVSIPVLSDASLPWPEKLFATREEAVEHLEDLSDRLLNWARREAGLPPIPATA